MIISGAEAIDKMRKFKTEGDSFFKLKHLTYNRRTGKSNGLRIVESAKARKVLRKETFEQDVNLYFTYYDNEIQKNRMCFKRLIRQVAFPPDYVWINVNWFMS